MLVENYIKAVYSVNMYPSSNLHLNYETEDNVYFFTVAHEVFNNFSAHSIEIWGYSFPTVEHAFQWKKFESTNKSLADKILKAKSPWAVKQLSNNGENRRIDWPEVKLAIMEELLREKIRQHVDVRDVLISTGEKKIIENSPVDDFWGIGPHGDGENHVGKLLLKIREELKNDH